ALEVTMAAPPATLRLANGMPARQDPTRIVARLADAGRAGDPVLTDRVRTRLGALGLAVEADPGQGGDLSALLAINHGPHLVWLRSSRKLARLPSVARVATALGRPLSWVAPVYRFSQVKGLDAYFAARPDVLLLRAEPEQGKAADEAAARFGLRRNPDKCLFPGGWRYLELPAGATTTAFDLVARLGRQAGGPAADFEYVPLQSPWLFTPDDPFHDQQWYLERIEAFRAWDIGRARRDIVIAVIDSGCDLDHPDLRDAYVSDGRNAGDPSADGSPIVLALSGTRSWHGTAVASVAGMGLHNATGMSGVAGGCGLYPIAMPEGSTAEFGDAIMLAIASGASVVNYSARIGEYWASLVRPMIDAATARGVVFCGASGNEDEPRLVFPARYPTFMACGGSDRADARWRRPDHGLGSGYGDELYDGRPTGVSVVAPGRDIACADLSGEEGYSPGASPWADYIHSQLGFFESVFQATSASTPQVAATAALLFSTYDWLTGTEIRRIIERTADKVGGFAYADADGYPNGSRHNEVGYGRLNVHRALDLGDVMIADWPRDTGVEPSAPPGGNFYSRSDVVLRPAGDDTFSPDSDAASRLERGADHEVAVRIRNVGPAAARDVLVDVRATPFVGLEFLYPDDWTLEDPLHVRPAPIDSPTLATLARGDTEIVRFGLTAAEVETLAGWSDAGWHPCLLAMTRAENDYAFATAPDGRNLVTRRNNLAQRNLTVIRMLEMRSARFPFVVGHPSTLDPRLDLIVESGVLSRLGEVYLELGDAGEDFPAARRAQAFARERIKVGRITGGKAAKIDGRPAIRLLSSRAVIELTRPSRARYALRLAVRLPAGPDVHRRYAVNLTQRVAGRGVTGGATVVFTP
ncbi:MAG TPA: S8 family serine peptidase, partial [Vicinamibacterales bacterium]|nr:S8 family serine peptidase [Vicinamibacterales bacterium]